MRSGGGDEELRRHLDPRHLGDDAVHRDDQPADAALEPRDAVAHDRRRQVEVRGRLDQRHALA